MDRPRRGAALAAVIKRFFFFSFSPDCTICDGEKNKIIFDFERRSRKGRAEGTSPFVLPLQLYREIRNGI